MHRNIRSSFLCAISLALVISLCSGCSFETLESKKDHIISFVSENREALLNQMEKVKNWNAEYYRYFSDDGHIKGTSVDWPYENIPVVNDEILRFFSSNKDIHSIDYPVNSDIIVFNMDGMGIAPSSVSMGFYYAPNDKPAWIDSEQLWIFPENIGRYNDYPMIQEGDGWIPDKSVLDPEKDSFLNDYTLYTERICENFFYYESSY